MDRQKLVATNIDNINKMKAEKAEIDVIIGKIKISPYFNCNYSEKQKSKLLNGEWKIGLSWMDLSADAGFHPTYFKNIYSYLCGYSHTQVMRA
jgi:hypothetical protein